MQTDIKNIGLTLKDFDLLVEGLDSLPEKGMAGDIMFQLIGGMISKGNEEMENKIMADREKEKAKRELERALQKDDIKILQGKLLSFKRYMIENGLLDDAKTIIEGVKQTSIEDTKNMERTYICNGRHFETFDEVLLYCDDNNFRVTYTENIGPTKTIVHVTATE